VYPNPASEFVTITNAENQTLVITDMLGKVVARINVSSSLETIDISNLNQGTYFMNINGKVSKLNIVK
ncbi:MAG TPA: T9SS type A sorting domain-containing protein, partial [Bacteroidales bacterium]|nr:T9SS type A sorting domain-containing protein [Bacteroidales bacterium]